MIKINPYLTFSGQCEAAFRCYEECIGGKILFLMTYAESPLADQVPPGWGQKILHATLEISGQILGGVDTPPDVYKPPHGFFVALNLDSATEANQIFETLAEGGLIQFPIQETFWALRYGTLIDRFGIPWLINCGRAD